MRKRLLGIAALVLLVGGCLGFFSLRPEPASPELRGREYRPVTRAISQRPVAVAAGHVFDEDGDPAEGISITARDEDDETTRVLTDADGHFDFGELRTPAWIAADAPAKPNFVGVRKPRDDIEFHLVSSCPLTVTVTGATGPITVEAHVTAGPPGSAAQEAEGREAHFDLPCGVVRVEAFAEGFPSAIGEAWTFEEETLKLTFEEGLRIYGHVTGPDGEPVEEAQLWGHVWAPTDAEGYYSALVEPSRILFFSVEAEAYRSEKEVVYVPDGTVELEHDIELDTAHLVEVFCAGLENDSCAELPLVLCTHPNAPVGAWCWEMGGAVTCRCPEGEAAVRAGGVSVLIAPDEDVAWLDMRTDGSLSGRILADGQPVSTCGIEATRFSLTADLGLRLANCHSDGRFSIENLPAGSWRLDVHADAQDRVVGPVEVDGPVDLGDIELDGGGLIHGVVLSEVDEEPVVGVSIAAVGLDALESGGAPPTGSARTDADGEFSIRGLPPGRYEVFLAAHPLERERVQLVDEARVELYRPVPGDLETEVDEDGNWVVTGVGDDAPEGFQEGDVIVGVEVFGVNPADVLPGWGREATPSLLGMAGWPGVTVITSD